MTYCVMSRLLDRKGIEILQVAIPSIFSYLNFPFNKSEFLPGHCIITVNHRRSIDRTVHINEATTCSTQSGSLDSRLAEHSQNGVRNSTRRRINSKRTTPKLAFLCILYYTILAVHVSGAICTNHQEQKEQDSPELITEYGA
jgi:hypothetical protein